MTNPLDHWEASIRAGKAAEAAIAITFFSHLGMVCQDNTLENVKNTDLRGNSLLEVKILKSPYPAAKSPAGLSPEEHLTLDSINVESYAPHTLIVMVVDYTASGVQTKGLYYITAGQVQALVKSNPKLAYSRSSRTQKDKVAKIAISTKNCGRIAFPGMTLADSVEEVLRAQKHPMDSLVALSDID